MNAVKTFSLLAVMTALFGVAGLLIGGRTGMMIALGVAAVMNLVSYWNSDRLVLAMHRAKQVDSGPLPAMVAELAQRAGLPTPKTYIIDSPQPNAFATGRNPSNAAVAVTTGLMRILNERELRAVMAHELAHILNRDTLTMTVTATLAGALGMLANYALFFGGNRDRPGGMIGTLAVIFLAPLAATLVRMTISRVREYEADRDGAMISGDPMALASSLSKLSAAAKGHRFATAEANPATAHLFIVNPLHGEGADNLFSTHPSVENRIQRLHAIAKEMGLSQHQDPRPREARYSDTSRAADAPPSPDRSWKKGPWG